MGGLNHSTTRFFPVRNLGVHKVFKYPATFAHLESAKEGQAGGVTGAEA